MIGIIGYQDDTVGFGLTGIAHLKEITQETSKEEILKAYTQLKETGVDTLIIHPDIQEIIPEGDMMIITIPQETTDTEDIDALAKELLGVQL